VKVTGKIVGYRRLREGAPERIGVLVRPAEDWEYPCEWKGGCVAALVEEALESFDPRFARRLDKHTIQICQYRLRIIGMKCGVGTYADTYLVMRDGWLAKSAAALNAVCDHLRRPALRFDRWLYALLGHPIKEGDYLPKKSVAGLLCRAWNPGRWEIS
jgi:hypothetical protein